MKPRESASGSELPLFFHVAQELEYEMFLGSQQPCLGELQLLQKLYYESSICFSKKLFFKEVNYVCLGELMKMRLSAQEGARAVWPLRPQGRELQLATSLGRAA